VAATYNREIGVFSNVAVVCWPSRKEAEKYFRYYAVANADRDAVENMIVGRALKTRRTQERLQMLRVRAPGGNRALLIVSDPDHVATMMKRLSEGGISALVMGFTNYLEHFPYFRDEALPRLVHEGLRAG
jgi:dimethylsulfone monooxygenase